MDTTSCVGSAVFPNFDFFNVARNFMIKADLFCKLTSPELQERKRTVLAELKRRILEKSETEKGYRYKFDGSDELLDLLTGFIKAERVCCSFFDFSFTVATENNFAWLELSGPEGTKDFIRNEIDF